MPSFGARLGAVFAERGRICLGIDPHAFLLEQWGLPDSAEGVREFGLRAVEAASGTVGIVKPQIAFFERHGAAGYAALEAVLASARDSQLLVIADVKRGDIGSTVAAYGQAWLTPGSPLEADAMTIVAYQGVGFLAEPIALARANDKGLFVLAATSNPEALATQTATLASGPHTGQTVAAGIVAELAELNAGDALGSFGAVIGATVDLAQYGITQDALASTPILAPGFGEQGAQVGDVAHLYGAAARGTIVNVSRSVLRSGPDGLAAALNSVRDDLARAL